LSKNNHNEIAMVTKEKIKEHFEQEIENHRTLVYLLYRDKKLLKEERFKEFAKELLARSEKGYWGSLGFAVMFFLLGSAYLFNTSSFGPYDLYLGFSYILFSLAVTFFSTKEYYGIKGSMTMLLKLIVEDEISERFELERAKSR